MAKFSISTLAGLAALQGVLAAPSPNVLPELIPGPGLPSLAELNITTAQLYEMGLPKEFPAEARNLEKRITGCGPSNNAYTNVNDIIACYNYLRSLGKTACSSRENQSWCVMGQAEIVGSAPYGLTSSYCQDAAVGVLWAINSCTRPDKSCAGFAPAYGNGNLIVGAYHKDYA